MAYEFKNAYDKALWAVKLRIEQNSKKHFDFSLIDGIGFSISVWDEYHPLDEKHQKEKIYWVNYLGNQKLVVREPINSDETKVSEVHAIRFFNRIMPRRSKWDDFTEKDFTEFCGRYQTI